jgi:hypothetical protein
MFRSKFKINVTSPAIGLQRRFRPFRLLAIFACILVIPLFITIACALVLHGEWRIIVREEFKAANGRSLVKLTFNTRTLVGRGKVRNKDGPSGPESLADFLRSTKLMELPCLFQFAFGNDEIDTFTAVPRSCVSWRSLSLWASVTPVPQLRYGDILMARFNDACDNGDITLANRLCADIETDLLGPLSLEPDEPRELLNQYSQGARRLTLVAQRLWHLRHPEPRQI